MFNIYATDYAPVDPITPPCEITPIFIGYKGENKARCLVFDLTECVETFGDGGFVISFIRQGDDLPYLVTDTDRLDNNAIWIITDTDTAVDGYGMVQLQYIVDDVVCKSALYRTVTFDSNSITGDVPDPYEDLLAQIAAYAAQAEGAATTATAAAQAASTAVENGITTERSQRIAADEGLNTRINELMGLAGAPSMANSAAAMTDSSKVYVYTGNEAGYLTGHWYYYNGSEWADGGVYQATAINTDKTLTVENMAADAAVVGEKIDECMAAFVTETVSGSIASFTDGADGVPVKDLVVNISPVQSGTGDPSPSNVRAITGWTETNIYRAGKNLLPNTGTTKTENGVTWIRNPDGTVTVSGTATGYTGFDIGVAKASSTIGVITVSGISGVSNIVWGAIELKDANAQIIAEFGGGSSVNKQTIDLSNYPNVDTIRVYVKRNNNTTTSGTLKPQIEVGSVVTDYEPYVETSVYNISFGSAGAVYGGTLDVTTGMLTVTQVYDYFDGSTDGKKVTGTDVDAASGANAGDYVYAYTTRNRRLSTTTQAVCDKFPVYINSWSRTEENLYFASSNVSFGLHLLKSRLGVVSTDTRTDIVSKMNTWLQSNNVHYTYELAQPVSYQLTPTEVKSLLANNNIWSDTGSVASCEYRADTKLYLEKLTNPDDDMIANANITSGSYFMVGNNLYLATANIANGGAISPGTNCTATNLAAALNAINS